MWSDLSTNYLTAGVSQLTSFIAASKKAKADKKWKDYNDKMTRLQDALNQNSITENELQAARREQAQEINIRKSGMQTEASIEASAAAAGVKGRSVNAALFDSKRNVANASQMNKEETEAQMAGFAQARTSSALSADLQINKATIPEPNPTTYMLGFAADAIEIRNKLR